jgi:Protein of unknown function (DUF4232)
MIAPPKPPVHDEPEALIKEAREHRRRRHLLTAAGVAIAAALGLGIYALAGGVGHPSTTGSSARGGAPPCRAPDLATTAEAGAGEGPGNAGASIQLVDTSSHACVLPNGIPTVTFTLHGKTAPAEERKMAPPYTQLGPRAEPLLVPGRKVMYMLDWSATCPSPGPALSRGERAVVTLGFRNGLRIPMPELTPENIPIVPGCEVGPPPTVLVTPLLRPS